MTEESWLRRTPKESEAFSKSPILRNALGIWASPIFPRWNGTGTSFHSVVLQKTPESVLFLFVLRAACFVFLCFLLCSFFFMGGRGAGGGGKGGLRICAMPRTYSSPGRQQSNHESLVRFPQPWGSLASSRLGFRVQGSGFRAYKEKAPAHLPRLLRHLQLNHKAKPSKRPAA